MSKILAVASAGGHWVQLLRIVHIFDHKDISFVSTKENFKEQVSNSNFYILSDFNRNNKKGLLKACKEIIKIIRIEKPMVIITTGAAPGLMAIIICKIFLIKTIWIDSIANIEELSMSGKIASYFADKIYTQWEHLATKKITYVGNVIT